MKILVTGVAGLLGSRLSDWLVENTDHDVIGVDDLSGGYIENVHDKVDFVRLDLVNLYEVERLFKKYQPDIVYHFAAYAAEGLSPFIRKFNYENNLIASTNLISKSIQFNVRRFVFASSMCVYGDQPNPPFSEDLLPRPMDPYGIAKYAVEMDLAVAFEQHGLPYTIIRPHNFYGVKQNIWDKYRNVLGIWMYQILNNQEPTIYGDGFQKRAFSYVDDSIEPFWRASQDDKCIGETINLGGIHDYTINDACEVVRSVTKTSLSAVHLEPRHEAMNAWSTWDKSVEYLGFEHKVDLEQGVTKMWEWAQHQPRRKRINWDNYELEKGIYRYWKNKD
tara:strand:+ start:5762 stop:6763 length:1002 start_codon:yes stop_codon:yes gene_type:complete